MEDHAVNRDGKDVQSATSQASMQDKAKGDTDRSHGLSQTSGGQDKKAKKEHPKAPEPIIGMNDERGQVCARPLTDFLDEAALTKRRKGVRIELVVCRPQNCDPSMIWRFVLV